MYIGLGLQQNLQQGNPSRSASFLECEEIQCFPFGQGSSVSKTSRNIMIGQKEFLENISCDQQLHSSAIFFHQNNEFLGGLYLKVIFRGDYILKLFLGGLYLKVIFISLDSDAIMGQNECIGS